MVKPISSKLRHMSVYSGATILGDGSVILIIEPAGIAKSVIELAARDQSARTEADIAAEMHASIERSLLLLFRAGSDGLKAIPLAFIGRLEEFDRAAIEDAGGKAVVQYQGRLMPLLGYAGAGTQHEPESRQPVLVFHQGDREIGMAVDEIVDVIEATISIDTSHASPGILGATIIDGKTVEIIDVTELVTDTDAHASRSADETVDIMVVEGSEFFRAIFAPLLQNAGYRVAVVSSVQAARGSLERLSPRAIILDLDQSGDAGFALAKELSEEREGAPPVIGTASRGGPRLIQKAKASGLYDLVGKFDRQGLLASVQDLAGGYPQGQGSVSTWGAAA